ncbi:MAG: BatA domain-containing protein [Vicinamibacterales bacterium]
MSFLAPLFFLGLAALAVPVLIHLTQRERKTVVEFPSLMFLRKIPYESVQRRRIRDWLLLALRLAALAMIVAAFARPFLRGSQLAAAPGGARDIVVLLDRSYSMGFGDTWARAQGAAAQALSSATPADRISLVLFADNAEVAVRSTPDRSRVTAEINATTPGPGSTKYGPAIKLAGSMLSESLLPKREVILVSDFQRGGWQPDDTLRLPGGTTLTPVAVAPVDGVNLALTPVSLQRQTVQGQQRVTVTAGVLNRSATPVNDVGLQLEIEGRVVQALKVNLAPNASASVVFAPVAVAAVNTHAAIHLSDAPKGSMTGGGEPSGSPRGDALARDNVFYFVLSPSAPVPVMVVGQGGRSDASLYLSRALAIGDAPRFDISAQSSDAMGAEVLAKSRLVILNDVSVPDALAQRLTAFVEGGGGLLIAAGPRASWPGSRTAWLPASIDSTVDRTRGAPAKLSAIDYGHVVFEPFRAPRSGDFATARFYTYRGLKAAKDATVLARFDTGEPALVERTAGRGHAIVFASTLDLSWNDLPLKPVFLPFIHQLGRRLSGYKEQPAWLTVGQVLDVGAAEAAAGATLGASGGSTSRTVLAPSGQRKDLVPPVAAPGAPPAATAAALELAEQGFYEVRGSGRESGPVIVAAANVSLAESNLDRLDPKELLAAVSGSGNSGPSGGQDVLPDEAQELAQTYWWYLLFAGILLLIAETVLAQRYSRAAR